MLIYQNFFQMVLLIRPKFLGYYANFRKKNQNF